MTSRITLDEAIEVAKRFADKIRAELDSEAVVYLYGSVARAQNNNNSDIDIAVVSRVFTNDVCANYACVNKIAFRVDDNIDAQAIIYEDWIDKTPFTVEVERQGVLIA
jgi:predicted nucleotidyltransferase